MDQYIGKMLDNRYEILELIGAGGMANVYKAKCHRLNRMVAVKILKNDLAENADFRRRFRDESLAVAQLSHANIVSVYDVSRSGDTEYIVMELVDGITLKQYMERRGKMDWREALHFITQIMRALSHAHSRGIIHRDIKPQNIMVLRDGSVKVTDFGIACLASASQTLTQEALGSVHYISPEQARGDRTDARSDIYSAGVVLYEMLTGRLPFEGESAVSVAIQHLSSVPLAPREIDPDIPEALELICMKAMCANLEKRYPSADAMLEDLEKFRKNNSVDLGYIRADLEEPEDHEPTQAIPTAAIQAARKERTPAEEKKRDKKLIAIVVGGFAAALLVVFLLFKFVFSGINNNPAAQSYKVPDVLGKTVEEAQQMEGIKGVFQIEVAGSKADSNYQPGQIIEQDPKSGHVRKNNLKITVWICAKEETNLMVNVLGKDVQDAKVELTNLNLNLNVQIREVYSDEYAAGKVISSTPAAGESIKKGDSILLTVSKGPETKPVTVQNYAGLSVDDAALQAENAGLTVGAHQYEYDATVPEGSVIRQSLAPKTEVAPGTEIVFTVSKGPEPSQTTEQTVTFDIPGEYLNPELGILNVEIRQDTTVVYSTTVDTTDPAAARSVSHTFTGDKGTSITVYLYINGTEVASQVVSFLSRGRIEKALSGFYYVRTPEGLPQCRARGKFRREGISPLVGDWVQVRDLGGGEGFVEAIEPRQNRFARPAAANIDQMVIIGSQAIPTTDPYLIDRIASIAVLKGCRVLLCLNKCDLDPAQELYDSYAASAIPVLRVSAATGEGLPELRRAMKGKLNALTGNSGVGKSSILNAMEPVFGLLVGEVSKALGRGRHTTRHVEMFPLDEDTYVIDTPGFSSFDTEELDLELKARLPETFPEFAPYLGQCRFVGCSHVKEKGCAVLQAVKDGRIPASRHRSYVRLYDELKDLRDWQHK